MTNKKLAEKIAFILLDYPSNITLDNYKVKLTGEQTHEIEIDTDTILTILDAERPSDLPPCPWEGPFKTEETKRCWWPIRDTRGCAIVSYMNKGAATYLCAILNDAWRRKKK